jgi:hypothetical protein
MILIVSILHVVRRIHDPEGRFSGEKPTNVVHCRLQGDRKDAVYQV